MDRRPTAIFLSLRMRSYLTLWGALVALFGTPGLVVVPQPLFAQSRDAALIQTLHHGQDPEARRQAAIRISKLDVTVALEPLMKALLADRSPIVRAACADALATLGTPASLSALRAATHDENAGVKQKAEAAVDKLTKLAAQPVEKLVVLISPPGKGSGGKVATSIVGLPQRLRDEFTRELKNSADIDLRDDAKALESSESAFSVESSVTSLQKRTTPRGELEVSCDINVTISLLPGKRVVGIVSGGASTFSPRDSAARVSKSQVADLESQALSQAVQAATENLLSFLRGQRKPKSH